MNYEEALDELMTALKGLCADVAAIPFRQRNVGNQKTTEQHFLVHIDSVEPTGISDNFEYGKSAKHYEVFVDLGCYRPSPNAKYAGTTTIQLQKILHAVQGHSGVYFKHFNTDYVTFHRAGTIQRRDWPLDKTQWEERSVVRLVFGMCVIEEDPVDVGWIETIQVNPLKVYDTPTHVAVEDEIEVTYP